ncbi:MAG: gamma-glutamyltransferase [Planctomycetes bacterium]|nr:gamma-glutamyltransferase [Planctomycetota bacterium]
MGNPVKQSSVPVTWWSALAAAAVVLAGCSPEQAANPAAAAANRSDDGRRNERAGSTDCGGHASPLRAAEAATGSVYQHAAVAADHPLASRAGVEILKQGGNVVDAAAAVSFALSVVRPYSSGIGGGGFMVIWNAETGEAVALDYRERAPRAATRDMFRHPDDPSRADSELSRRGALAVGVPGTVAGLCYAVENYGRLALKDVLAPAIRLAREGVPLDETDLAMQRETLAAFEKHAAYRERFAVLHEQYLNGGRPWKAGEKFHSPQLAVLERIATRGPAAFYEGEVADALLAEIQRGGGLITREDLAAMRPVVRRPLVGRFRGDQIVTMPPPSSGGVALLETLNVLSAYGQRDATRRLERLEHNSADYVHLVTEALKHSFADRAEFLGDIDFADVPVERLTSADYAAELAEQIDPERKLPQERYGRFQPVEDGGTSHFSIIDAAGNAVACTETINLVYGSYVVEPKFGIVLNDEMDDFAAAPGQPNAFGLVQSEANAIQPGKKPLSSMTPTIVIRDGKAVHVVGASGGPRIISSTLQVLLNLSRFGMTPAEAVQRPRFHHQWLPDELALEDPLFGNVRETLAKRGHKVDRREAIAAVQAASRDREGLRASSDPRKRGKAAGY